MGNEGRETGRGVGGGLGCRLVIGPPGEGFGLQVPRSVVRMSDWDVGSVGKEC